MNKKFSDELISAYLDGELTPDEQAEVERMLLDSAEHRRMFDELRALRQSLQSLPRYELDRDFSQRVLRRAERAMLAGGDTRPLGDPPEPPAVSIVSAATTPEKLTPPSPISPVTLSADFNRQAAELKRWRRISWVSVSVAAASLMIAAIVGLRGGQPYNVALSDSLQPREKMAADSAVSGITSAPAPDRMDGDEDGNNYSEKSSSEKAAALHDLAAPEGAGPGAAGGLGGAAPANDFRQRRSLNEQLRGGAAAPTDGTPSPIPTEQLLGVDPKSAGASAPPALAAPATASAEPGPRYAGKPPAEARRENDKAQRSRAVSESLEKERANSYSLKRSADSVSDKGLVNDTDAVELSRRDTLARNSEIPVIRLKMSPDAFRHRFLDQVLADQKIAFFELHGEKESLRDSQPQNPAAAGKAGKKLNENENGKPNENMAEKLVDKPAAPIPSESKADITDFGFNSISSGLEIVLVDAPVEQLEAALQQLAKHSVEIFDTSAPRAELRNESFLRRAGIVNQNSARELDRKKLEQLDQNLDKHRQPPAPTFMGGGGGGVGGFAKPNSDKPAGLGLEPIDETEKLTRKLKASTRLAAEKENKPKAKSVAGGVESKKAELAATAELLVENSSNPPPSARALRLLTTLPDDRSHLQFDRWTALPTKNSAEKSPVDTKSKDNSAATASKRALAKSPGGAQPPASEPKSVYEKQNTTELDLSDANRKSQSQLAERDRRMVRVILLIEIAEPGPQAAEAAPPDSPDK